MVAALTVPAFAYDYKDDAAIDPKYKEAIDVLYAMDVMKGSATGNFDPKYPLSRGQMAMLMFIVDSGGNRDAKLWANVSHNFTDINGMFYTNHIKWAYAQGIVGGVTPTLFRPANKLTAIEALGFALGIIGYNRNIEGFHGADWKNKIIMCLEKNKNLFLLNKLEHLSGNLGSYITREETAQMIYNMMFIQMVEYKDGKAVPANWSVGPHYFDYFEAGTGILLANDWAAVDGGPPAPEGYVRIENPSFAVEIKAEVPLAFLGREVKFVHTALNAGLVFPTNTDTVVTTTIDAANKDEALSGTAGAVWDWDDAEYFVNYVSETDLRGPCVDNPVTLVLKGKKVQFALAIDYTFEKITDVKANGTISSTSVLTDVKPADIVIGANLAVKDAWVLAAKLGKGPGFKYALAAVTKLTGTCTEFAAADFYKINGTNYKPADIEGQTISTFTAGDLGKASDFYLFGGKLVGFVPPAVPAPITANVIVGRSATIANGIKYYVYDIASKSQKEYEFVAEAGKPFAPATDDKFNGIASGTLVKLTFKDDKIDTAAPIAKVYIKEDFKLKNAANVDVDNGFVQLTLCVRSDASGLKLATLTDDATPTKNIGKFNYDGIEVIDITMATTGVTIAAKTFDDLNPASGGTNINGALVYIDGGKIISAFTITK